MPNRRLLLHEILCDILSCPIQGNECRCYFQPPETLKMKYPAIVYSLNDVENFYADDGVYLSKRVYSLTLIEKNPDSEYISKLLSLPTCNYDRHYVSDNLNHDVFEIYF